MTFEKAAAASFTASQGNNVIVITDAVTQTGAAMQTKLAAINTANSGAVSSGVIVISADSTGDAYVWFDADVSTGASVQLATLVGVSLSDLASLTASNFAVA